MLFSSLKDDDIWVNHMILVKIAVILVFGFKEKPKIVYGLLRNV